MKIKSQLLLIFLVLFLLCFFYIWPGVWRYRYYEAHRSWGEGGFQISSGSATYSMRTDRLTGQVQVYREGRWQKKE